MPFDRICVFLVLLGAAASADAAEPIDIGSRRELFVDRLLIDSMTGTSLKLHRPICADVAIRRDKPWEGTSSFGYVTVFRDRDLYRMYYRAIPGAEKPDGSPEEMICYAESTDGIRWTKPDLNLYAFEGSTKNNIVLTRRPPFCHNFTPLLDTRPGVPADERYKALAGITPYSKGLAAFSSPDGIHWKQYRQDLVIRSDGPAFDSQNVAFWSETEHCYVCYYRILVDNIRSIARVTSKDFTHWTDPAPMRFRHGGTKPTEHIYTNQTQPYFRAPHICISMAARFMPGRRALTDAEVRELQSEKDSPSWLTNDCSDAVLMSTRGDGSYDRTFREGWILPGTDFRDWVSRSNYPACGIVQTNSAEMSLYVTRRNGQPSVYVGRCTLRIDGFASIRADYQGGEILTRPLIFAGRRLEINFATSAAGSLRVEIQDEAGRPIPGFAAQECPEIVGDRIDHIVAWRQGSDVSKLAGRPVRLRLLMKDADLYSIRFQ